MWQRLLDQYKGRLPVNVRVMLNMVSGVVNGDCLTVLCRDDFTLKQLDKPEVTAVLREVTSADQGRDIRVALEIGQAPSVRRAAPRPAPPPLPKQPPRPEVPEPPKPAPAGDTPPWEAPAPAPGGDKLNELLQNGQQLDSFQIK